MSTSNIKFNGYGPHGLNQRGLHMVLDPQMEYQKWLNEGAESIKKQENLIVKIKAELEAFKKDLEWQFGALGQYSTTNQDHLDGIEEVVKDIRRIQDMLKKKEWELNSEQDSLKELKNTYERKSYYWNLQLQMKNLVEEKTLTLDILKKAIEELPKGDAQVGLLNLYFKKKKDLEEKLAAIWDKM